MDVFTREYGRFRVLAKGARRQKTGNRAQLQAFQFLRISWSGKRSLHTLTGVETSVVRPKYAPEVLASLYYMNELLFKFLHANDAHERLFDAYDDSLQCLAKGQSPDDILRYYECALLREVGYGLIFDHDVNTGEAVDDEAQYFYYPEKGPVRIATGDNKDETSRHALQVSGRCLNQLAKQALQDNETRRQGKRLLRNLLTRQVRSGEFRSRRVFSELLRYTKAQQDNASLKPTH